MVSTIELPQTVRKKVMDSNEPGIIREKLYELGWEQQKLLSGDYWFFAHDYKKVGITRKSVNDLLGSLGGTKVKNSKRRYPLPKQLEEMIDEYNILIFLLEGSWKFISPSMNIVSSRGIEYHTWSMVWNFLRRWQDKGFTLEFTVNEGHTIHRLNELYALYQKPYSLSANTREYTDDRVLAFPSGCRGKTAMDCLATFGSLQAVACQDPEELMQVNNVGEKKAALIYSHFHREEDSGTLDEKQTAQEEEKQGEQLKLV